MKMKVRRNFFEKHWTFLVGASLLTGLAGSILWKKTAPFPTGASTQLYWALVVCGREESHATHLRNHLIFQCFH